MKLTKAEIKLALKDIKTIQALTVEKIEGLKAELNEATCQDDIKIIHSMITNHVNQYMELQQREEELKNMNTASQIENALNNVAFFFRPVGFNGPELHFMAERHNNIYYVAKSHEDEEYSLEEVRERLENNKWILC